MLTLLLTSVLTLAFDIKPVKGWTGTVYIRADGSIDPLTAPITSADSVTYTFTGSISSYADGIVVERSNIIIDGRGYTLEGSGTGNGFHWSNINNVTIKNTNIQDFEEGVYISSSSSNTLLRNNIANNKEEGIWFLESSDNGVYENDIVANYYSGATLASSLNNIFSGNNIANNGDGIHLGVSSNNSIHDNIIIANTWYGVSAWKSTNNSIYANNIVNNRPNVYLDIYCSDNSIYHNNLIGNEEVEVWEYGSNAWDDGYPSGGNYWSDYVGSDSFGGLFQNETGSDGIGDTPYIICVGNQDRYPLMNPYVSLFGDVNCDGKVDMKDVGIVAQAFGSFRNGSRWNPLSDMDKNGIIDLRDIGLVAKNFGKHYP
jgi:parallel beta-helix repeat protein